MTDGADNHHPVQTGSGLLTPVQVSEFLQIKVPTIYELVKGRRLRAVKVGRLLRFRAQDVETYLERKATGRW